MWHVNEWSSLHSFFNVLFLFSVPFVPRLLCCEYVVGYTDSRPQRASCLTCGESSHQVEQPSNRSEGCHGAFWPRILSEWSGENPGSILINFLPFLSNSISIHFLSISFQFLFIRIHFYPFLSIAYSCLWSKISQVRRTLWYAAHNHAMQKPNNILNHFDPFLECRPTHRGLFEVGQNEMEACFLEPPCQPAISAIAICQRKKNVASVEKQSSIALITFNHSMTLSSGTACDTVLRASLLSPPELWHVAANSMHHGTCSFTWGPRTDSWAFHNRSTHNSYQAYIKLHAEVNAHQFLVSKLLKINQSLTLKASRRFTWLCEVLRQWPTI